MATKTAAKEKAIDTEVKEKAVEDKPSKPLKQWRVISGGHQCHPQGMLYLRGMVFETSSDMTKHNKPGLRPKYELMPAGTPVTQPGERVRAVQPHENVSQPEDPDNADGLTGMSLSDLQAFAEEGEIDIRDCSDEAAIIDKIRAVA